MISAKAQGMLALAICFALLFPVRFLTGQVATASISGKITGTSGAIVANARVSLKNLATGQVRETLSDATGAYKIIDLMQGKYEISVQGDGFTGKTLDITLAPASSQKQDFALTAPGLPNAPSLQDLGFGAAETQANPQLQALLQKRTEMLKIHQRLGLITAIPMTATLITGPMVKAKGKDGEPITEPSQANLDFHAALGGLTTALYFTTAYYAIFAPRVSETPKHGAIRMHEALAFIHGPGMILTPILGYMAYKQENAGEKVHGIASAHGTVAWVTAGSYGAAIVAVSWPIHLKFWEKK